MRIILAITLILTFSSIALAETKLIDTTKIPAKKAHDVADLLPIAVTNDGTPSVVILELKKGDVVPPHAAKSGLRLLTVLSGDMYWGDGDEVETGKERTYMSGSHLLVQPGDMHWLAARNNDVRIQMVLLHDQKLTPPVAKQIGE
ncbi:MAG: hypothetical protein AAF362_03145 [Pseudomonadota bacterium]